MISFTSNALINMVEILFSQEKVPLNVLKINWSVKTLDIGLVWELLILGYGLLFESIITTPLLTPGGVTWS